MARELGMDALRQVNQRALEFQERDAVDLEAAAHRINFGLYFFAAPPDAPERAPDPDPAEEGPDGG